MHPSVHSSIIYNYQDMEETKDGVYIYTQWNITNL